MIEELFGELVLKLAPERLQLFFPFFFFVHINPKRYQVLFDQKVPGTFCILIYLFDRNFAKRILLRDAGRTRADQFEDRKKGDN